MVFGSLLVLGCSVVAAKRRTEREAQRSSAGGLEVRYAAWDAVGVWAIRGGIQTACDDP